MRKFLYIKDSGTNIGNTLCIKAHVPKNMVIFKLKGPIYNQPTRESIHIGDNKHIKDVAGQYMNHSFSPTTRIFGKNVIALKHIMPGDELTFNYNESEINMAYPFICRGQIVRGL
tara:strand:- start:1347 stop:1691 length:345 start_codon:yes stop_codon:yes gene_type:complete